MNHPPLLKPGDRVCVISPSGPIQQHHLDYGLQCLENWGLKVEVDRRAFARKLYLAGDDSRRLNAIQQAIDDPGVKAVFCSRGGYGLSRIVDELCFSKLINEPKWVIGFSDISALLLALFENGIGGAVHAPVLKSFELQKQSIGTLFSLLFEGVVGGFEGKDVGKKTKAQGQLWGGNLSLILSELASGSIHIPDQAVVFLEDIGEVDYRLDRLLTTFKRAARDAKISALLLGQFNDCAGVYVDEDAFPAFMEGLAIELAAVLHCPVLMDLPFGHTSQNEPLLLGLHAEVNAGSVRFSSISRISKGGDDA